MCVCMCYACPNHVCFMTADPGGVRVADGSGVRDAGQLNSFMTHQAKHQPLYLPRVQIQAACGPLTRALCVTLDS